MKDYQGEEVLVVPRALFDELGAFQGCSTEVECYLPSLLDPANNFFMPRAAAEDDPSHKQIIPYCLFRWQGRYLHYTRGKSGGESRLHAQGSVGVGGHINPADQRHLAEDTYRAAIDREIAEELRIDGSFTHRPVALLNDDSNPVGSVHLGVIHLVELDVSGPEKVAAAEDALHNLSFQTPEALRGPLRPRLETWSQHAVDCLDKF